MASPIQCPRSFRDETFSALCSGDCVGSLSPASMLCKIALFLHINLILNVSLVLVARAVFHIIPPKP